MLVLLIPNKDKKVSIIAKTMYVFSCVLGFMKPSGKLTSRVKEKANTKLDNMFSLKESHSIEEMLWNQGLEWLSTRLKFLFQKRCVCP